MSDAYAVTVAILFVAAGFALAVVAKRVFGVGDAGLSISLLIVPFAIFLIASGRIERFEGWGIKATFQRLAGTDKAGGQLPQAGLMADQRDPASLHPPGQPA